MELGTTINTICYSVFAVWAIFSIKWMWQLKKQQNPNAVNPYCYDSIPTGFTTIGVLGTFVGIFYGLQDFDTTKITESIPTLLEGLKTAFSTSIIGISLSFVFGRISQGVLNQVEKQVATTNNNELAALNEIIKILTANQKQSDTNIALLNKSLIGDSDSSIATYITKIRNQFTDFQRNQEIWITDQTQVLAGIQSLLGTDDETSLLTQIQKLRAELNDYSKENKKNIEWIVKSMKENNELISEKFDEFADLLAKNNTEALVNVMKEATEQFNAQMSALIEKLVQENFQELNNSVQRMNDWQHENKEMIATLTAQFKQVSEDFAISSTSIKEITGNTNKLTNENSHLSKLIQELQKVMIEDTKYQEIVGKLTATIDTLKENTDAFDETTHKLNDWVKNQMNFSNSVAKLLTRLEEIEKIKDLNDVFWNNTKQKMIEGVSIISNASQKLSNDLENIDVKFYERLNVTLQTLDRLIQRMITDYKNMITDYKK
jgi:hypothetical protein